MNPKDLMTKKVYLTQYAMSKINSRKKGNKKKDTIETALKLNTKNQQSIA
jgi:hypothetical protein